jgi:hypothetical protein
MAQSGHREPDSIDLKNFQKIHGTQDPALTRFHCAFLSNQVEDRHKSPIRLRVKAVFAPTVCAELMPARRQDQLVTASGADERRP